MPASKAAIVRSACRMRASQIAYRVARELAWDAEREAS